MAAQKQGLSGFHLTIWLGALVWFETYRDVSAAIDREKQIKAGSRAKKIALIECENPRWDDLSVTWF
jgi:putative endonuclease